MMWHDDRRIKAIVKGAIGFTTLCAIAFSVNCAQAQITPDTTLPNNSTVTLQGNTDVIEGGTRAGGNLFHSFKEFSVPTGGTAFFNNTVDIQNIISRVTGKSVSNIDGLIRANGTANLFLINPSGIIFGENASLNIGGSFVASTASSLKFASGFEFSATNPQTTPLLTISVPIGLQFGDNPGSIQLQGSGNHYSQDLQIDVNGNIVGTAFNRSNRPVGLQVQPNKTLALVGGEVALKGGNLTAPEGQIELGSVAGNGFVSLNPVEKGWSLGYIGVQNFGSIQLSQAASVDVSGVGGGDIQVRGKDVALTDGSVIVASTLGAKPGGTITVVADDAVELTGTDANHQTFSGLFTESLGSGQAGDIAISTGKLIVRDGAQVASGSFQEGVAGKLTVTAPKSIELVGSADLTINKLGSVTIPSALASSTTGIGTAGDVSVQTGILSVINGANIQSLTWGNGAGGNLSVKASELVELIGVTPDGDYPSTLSTGVQPGAMGTGGNLSLETRQLTVRHGAQIQAGTFGAGSAGNLAVKASELVELIGIAPNGKYSSILSTSVQPGATGIGGNLSLETRQLIVRGGAQIQASTSGIGSAGTLVVKASSIQLSGTAADGKIPSSLTARSRSTGNAGDLRIETGQLTVENGAGVTVSSSQGQAGNLTVTAKDIRLNQGRLTAETAMTHGEEGANIKLQGLDFLLLQNHSLISAQASGNARGGNITIDADINKGFVVAPPLQNSDIIANATLGNGGNITINARQVFGLTPGQAIPGNKTNDIDASSQFNQPGTVTINTPDLDPSRGLIQLPTNVVDVSGQIVNGCTPGSRQSQSSFIATGRGGLPISPNQPLQDTSMLSEWVRPRTKPATSYQVQLTPVLAKSATQIVEAQGWVADGNGDLVLVAQTPQTNPRSSWQAPVSCPGS